MHEVQGKGWKGLDGFALRQRGGPTLQTSSPKPRTSISRGRRAGGRGVGPGGRWDRVGRRGVALQAQCAEERKADGRCQRQRQ